MPVYPRTDRPGAWWIDVYVGSRRIRRTVRLDKPPSTRESERLERALVAEVAAKAAARPKPRGAGPTYGELAARYWSEHAHALGAAADVWHHLQVWKEAFGEDAPAESITGDRIAAAVGRWRLERSRGGAPKDPTINRRMATLRAMTGRAADVWGWQLPRIPWRRLWLAEPEPAGKGVSEHDRERYLAAVAHPAARLALTMEAVSGARIGTVLAMRRADMDWHKGVVRAVTKGRAGGKAVEIPMTEAVLAVIQALGPLPAEGPIFPVRYKTLWTEARLALARIGMEGVQPSHVFRHSFAQDLEDAGEGHHITAALHHSTPALRRRYARSSPGAVAGAIARARTRKA